MVMVPVPVPVYIPVPMNMYSQNTPVAMPVHVPIPVPVVMSPQKEMKDAAVQYETIDVIGDEQKDEATSCPDQSSSNAADLQSDDVSPTIRADAGTQKAEEVALPVPGSPEKSSEPAEEASQTTSASLEQPPSSPMMDLETDLPAESLVQKASAPKRGVKRPREGSSSRKRSRRRTAASEPETEETPPISKLNHMYGVKAWKSWARLRRQQPQDSCPGHVSEDVFECSSAELSFALSRFVREVRRPNGDAYSPDSIFYLCLGIQQYLFMKGRIENIFTDELYSEFASEITGILRLWKPKLLPSGCSVSSRVEESYLWECKQLGAYSPIVLLNTLLFFCTKNFNLTTLAEHRRLSFALLVRSSKSCSRSGKVHYLLYQRSKEAPRSFEETEPLRRRTRENKRDLEMLENVANPLYCPVRLYEFYLSRCPESVKKRSDMFYLQPEQNVHTKSSHWFTCQALDDSTLQSMLTRILAVREVQQEHKSTAGGSL
ncbi:unnamed protein product [Ophioblennius macclurei]